MYVVDDTYYFTSLFDFISTVKNAPRLKGRSNASEDGDRSFTGTRNLQEAWELCEKGDAGNVGNAVLENLERLNVKPTHKATYNDVVGFAANVPNYLMGVPKTMINREVRIYRDKIVNVLVNPNVNCHVSTEEIVQKATEVFEVVLKLEQEGYRVNLYRMLGSSLDDVNERVLGFIKIKDDRERINIKKMLFPLTHPSMQRRLDFYFREAFGKVDVTHDGYGSQRKWKKEFVAKQFQRTCPGDFLYANLSDYDRNWYKSAMKPKEDTDPK